VVICLDRGADLNMAELMSLPLTVSCFSKIQIGFTFVVPAHLGSPGQRAVKRVCVCLCVCVTSASSALGVLDDYALYKSTHSLGHSLAGRLPAAACSEGGSSGGQWSLVVRVIAAAPVDRSSSAESRG